MSIFRSGADLTYFCDQLRKLKKKFPCELYAFCLMSNHFHLLMRGGENAVCTLMHRLMTNYAMYFNATYAHTGRVFEDRNWQKECLDDRYFVTLLRYIHRNPIAAGLVLNARDWKYSGHRELLGEVGQGLVDTSFPLECFDSDLTTARASYLELFEQEQPVSPALAAIERVCAIDGIQPEELLGVGNRRHSDLRHKAIRMASEAGASTKQIMTAFKCSQPTVSRALAYATLGRTKEKATSFIVLGAEPERPSGGAQPYQLI